MRDATKESAFNLEDERLAGKKVFVIYNKADLLKDSKYNNLVKGTNIFVISAKFGRGIEELKNGLYQSVKDLVPNADSTFVTNVRHYEALTQASAALQACRDALSLGIPSDLVAEDLRRALASINAILGTDLLDPEVILHSIFSKHCIGK